MDKVLKEKFQQALWIAKTLFESGKATGSSSNMSFMHGGNIYITGSGTCFGTLKEEDFSVVNNNGENKGSKKPSKELPLHKIMYEKNNGIGAVIHTHSFYTTLWSCLEHEDTCDVIPTYTPYLKMKLGKVGLIPYAKPGSKELFDLFKANIGEQKGYLLKNHGVILGHKDLMSTFYCHEELVESTRIAWEFRNKNVEKLD